MQIDNWYRSQRSVGFWYNRFSPLSRFRKFPEISIFHVQESNYCKEFEKVIRELCGIFPETTRSRFYD
jgi:hypothetical protein